MVPAFAAHGLSVCIEVQPLAELGHPTDLLGGIANDQGIGGDVFCDHGSGADEGVRSDVVAADDGGIGADAGSATHVRTRVLAPSIDGAAGVDDVGKHTAGAQEHVVIARDAFVDGDVVLDFDIGAEAHTG